MDNNPSGPPPVQTYDGQPQPLPPQDPAAAALTPVKRKPGRPKGSTKKNILGAEPTPPKIKRPVGRPRKDGFPAGSVGTPRPRPPRPPAASAGGSISVGGGTMTGVAYPQMSVSANGPSHFPLDPSLEHDDWARLARTSPNVFLSALLSGLAAPNPVSSAGPSVEEAFKSHLNSLAPHPAQPHSPIPSLYSILKTFWLPSSPAYFSLTASASTARTPSEHRFLYWDPQPLVFNGISCPSCASPLTNNGRISTGPIKVYDIEKPFFIIGCEYVCTAAPCLSAQSPPQPRRFASTDSSILRSLPLRLKEEFPARLLFADTDAGPGPNIWNWGALGVSAALLNLVRGCLRAGMHREGVLALVKGVQAGGDAWEGPELWGADGGSGQGGAGEGAHKGGFGYGAGGWDAQQQQHQQQQPPTQEQGQGQSGSGASAGGGANGNEHNDEGADGSEGDDDMEHVDEQDEQAVSQPVHSQTLQDQASYPTLPQQGSALHQQNQAQDPIISSPQNFVKTFIEAYNAQRANEDGMEGVVGVGGDGDATNPTENIDNTNNPTDITSPGPPQTYEGYSAPGPYPYAAYAFFPPAMPAGSSPAPAPVPTPLKRGYPYGDGSSGAGGSASPGNVASASGSSVPNTGSAFPTPLPLPISNPNLNQNQAQNQNQLQNQNQNPSPEKDKDKEKKTQRSPRHCCKCGSQTCKGKGGRAFCAGRCQDCGKLECKGRNSRRPEKSCGEGWG